MTERHTLAGPARGESRPSGNVGACVRLPLDGPPSARWSAALSARLAASLTGHAAVGHLRIDQLVQGADIVLEGVEPAEAGRLGPVLREAIAAANGACCAEPVVELPRNMEQREADAMAEAVEAGARLAP